MKKWFALTCLLCGRRYPLKKFNPTIEPITYPAQIVSGGGRAKGFRVVKYLPWSSLPALRQTEVWASLLGLYSRLAASYDSFYEVLGFLSPKMTMLLQGIQKSYVNAYRTSPFSEYSRVYDSAKSSQDVVEAYVRGDDYAEAYVRGDDCVDASTGVYASLRVNHALGGICSG